MAMNLKEDMDLLIATVIELQMDLIFAYIAEWHNREKKSKFQQGKAVSV